MKKTRQILSLVLAMVVALASMPLVYTGTAAAGTIDNPTLPVKESDNYSQKDTNNLTFSQGSLNFTYYQTINDEYFKLTQKVDTKKYCGVLNALNTVNVAFNSYALADDDASTSFVNNSQGAISWSGNNSNSPADAFSGKFELEGVWSNCPDYSWISTVIFKGASADKEGKQTLGYTQVLDYTTEINGTVNNYQIPVTTTITILDARVFAEELAKAESVVANPEDYSAAYVSAVQATLNDIPEGLKTLTEVYSQDVIDSCADKLAAIPENAADYTEYNRVYEEYKSFTNSDGVYTTESHKKYLAELESINTGLSKALDATQQSVVDAAIQAIKNAYENTLVTSSREDTKTPAGYTTTGASSDDGKVSVSVDNSVYKFMQIEDEQVFGFAQTWTISRGSSEWGDQTPDVYGIVLDTSYPSSHSGCLNAPEISVNHTNLMFDRLTPDSFKSFQSTDEDGISADRYEFLKWNEVNEDGTDKSDTTVTEDGTGRFDADRNFEIGDNRSYYFQLTPTFVGLTGEESGAISLNFVQRIGYKFRTGTFSENERARHIHIVTTIDITDARALVKAYNEAVQSLESPENHSAEYIEALQKVVSSVPQDMVNGTKYYTQAEVDSYYEQLNGLNDNKADYEAFNKAYQRVEDILANPESYSGETLAAAQAAKEQADKLDKNLIDSAENRNLIANVTAALNAAADNAKGRADYSTYYLYLDIAYNRNGVAGGVNPSNYTGNSYAQFIKEVERIDNGLKKDLPDTEEGQAKVNEAVDALAAAYNLLESHPKTPSLTDEEVFTESNIADEYTMGNLNFSLGSSVYNFVQTKYDEDFVLDVNFVANNINSTNYTIEINSLKVSSLDKNTVKMCHPEQVCLNSDSVTTNDALSIFFIEKYNSGGLVGLEPYTQADTNGDSGRFTTWQSVSGNDLSLLSSKNDVAVAITQESAAKAQFVYRGLGGSETERVTQEKNYTYVLRLAWTETNIATGEKTVYHTHIPVELNFTDARELFANYTSYKAFVDAGNDGTYTDASFHTAKDIVYSVNSDIAFGAEYASQDAVTAEMEKLNSALSALKSKEDYSQVDALVAQVQGMLNDSDVKYTQESIEALENALSQADALNKDLEANAENKATIQAVVDALQAAIDGAQTKADYTEFDKVVEDLENIVNNPDDFVKESVDAAKDALEKAELNSDLPATEQEKLDAVTEELRQVVENAKEKADYGDFDSWYEQIEDILSNSDNYTSETVEKAQAAKDAADDLGKDQPAENQDLVNEVINSMKDVVDNKKEKADYTDYNKAWDEANKLENNGSYDEDAFNDYKIAVEALDKELSKDLTKDEQDLVDDKTQELKDLRTELDATRGYEESIIDPKTDDNDIKNDVLAEIEQNQGYTEDELIVEFRNYLGEELADESFVGTGSTMRVILKSTGELIEYKLFIVMGDVDGDGCITNDDYEKSIAVGMEDIVYSEEQQYFFIANDVAVDGVIDVLDAFYIRRMAAKSV